MIYLSGTVRAEIMDRRNVGVLLTRRTGRQWWVREYPTTPWAVDTDCFSAPDQFDLFEYLEWLDSYRECFPTCLFATAPDRVGDPVATLKLSIDVLPLIRRRVPAALVAQDGLEKLSVPWDAFDALFIGGTTGWKLSESAWQLIHEAKGRGKFVHMGRVNSLRRLRASAQAGCDSADGTYLAFGPDTNLPKLERWLDRLNTVPHLPLWCQEKPA